MMYTLLPFCSTSTAPSGGQVGMASSSANEVTTGDGRPNSLRAFTSRSGYRTPSITAHSWSWCGPLTTVPSATTDAPPQVGQSRHSLSSPLRSDRSPVRFVRRPAAGRRPATGRHAAPGRRRRRWPSTRDARPPRAAPTATAARPDSRSRPAAAPLQVRLPQVRVHDQLVGQRMPDRSARPSSLAAHALSSWSAAGAAGVASTSRVRSSRCQRRIAQYCSPPWLRHRRIQLVLGSVMDARVSCLPQHRVIQAGPAASTAVASCPAWRTVNARKIWEKPRNSAKKPTQNRIKTVRWARA
jgi:hypothetical protein